MPEVSLISGRDFQAVQKIATICPTSEFIRGIPFKVNELTISDIALDKQETFYRVAFPVVRLFWSVWSLVAVLMPISLMITGAQFGLRSLSFSVLSMALFLLATYLLGGAALRLSMAFAIVLLVWCVPTIVLYISVFFIGGLAFFLGRVDYTLVSLAHLSVAVSGAWIVYFGFICLRAAYKVIKSSQFDRMLTAVRFGGGTFSKRECSALLGLPTSVEFINKRSRLKVLLYFVLSWLFFSWFGIVLFSAPLFVSTIFFLQDPSLVSRQHVLIINALAAVSALVSVLLAGWTRAAGRRSAIASLEETLKIDSRPPILFLRAFRDNQVELLPPQLSWLGKIFSFGVRKTNLDILLLEEATEYGPVIALKNPTSPDRLYGAARGAFDQENWREHFAKLAATSRAVVICLDDTEGVLWELDYIEKNNLKQKTLFLIHPRHSLQPANELFVQKVDRARFGNGITEKKTDESLSRDKMGAVLGFFYDEGVMRVGRSFRFSQVGFLMMVRWFLRKRVASESGAPDAGQRLFFIIAAGLALFVVVWTIWSIQISLRARISDVPIGVITLCDAGRVKCEVITSVEDPDGKPCTCTVRGRNYSGKTRP